MRTRFISLAVFLLSTNSLFSQAELRSDTLTIQASERFLSLERAFPDYNAGQSSYAGYRIQVFNGRKADAEALRAKFLRNHEDLKVYLSYDAPEYRVQVGDFRDRISAESVAIQLQRLYGSAFVVDAKINSPSWEETQGKKSTEQKESGHEPR